MILECLCFHYSGTVGQAPSRHTEANSNKKSETTVADAKKSSSFISGMQVHREIIYMYT